MSIRDAIRAIDAASRTSVAAIKSWRSVERADGYKYVEPKAQEIADAAQLPRDRVALAAMVTSEVGSLPAQYLIAVTEVVRSEAAARGISPFELLTRGGQAGHFGGQSGRYAASGQKPTERALAAVLQVEAGVVRGFARGARNFFDGKVQDGGTQGGKALSHDALGIVRKWYSEGKKWVGEISDGGEILIDPYRLMLFAREGRPLAEAEAAILDGRDRWRTGRGLPPAAIIGGGVLLAALAGVGWLYTRG